MLAAMVERIGFKSTARMIKWNPGPVHYIVVNDDWTQRTLYPEDVTQIELVHDVVMHYAEISDEARTIADQLIEQSHLFVTTARELRRLLRKM